MNLFQRIVLKLDQNLSAVVIVATILMCIIIGYLISIRTNEITYDTASDVYETNYEFDVDFNFD